MCVVEELAGPNVGAHPPMLSSCTTWVITSKISPLLKECVKYIPSPPMPTDQRSSLVVVLVDIVFGIVRPEKLLLLLIKGIRFWDSQDIIVSKASLNLFEYILSTRLGFALGAELFMWLPTHRISTQHIEKGY